MLTNSSTAGKYIAVIAAIAEVYLWCCNYYVCVNSMNNYMKKLNASAKIFQGGKLEAIPTN